MGKEQALDQYFIYLNPISFCRIILQLKETFNLVPLEFKYKNSSRHKKGKKKMAFKIAVTDIGQIVFSDCNQHSDLGSIRVLLTTNRRQCSS